MTMQTKRLATLVGQLASRPGHETVRALLNELCVVGLDIPTQEVSFEVRIPEVRGRIDALFGSTVFEFKRDLRKEKDDAEEQLLRYMAERESSTKRRYLGIATDGADFVAYQLTDRKLTRLRDFQPNLGDPRALLRWLDTAITVRDDLPADAVTIRQEFGRDGLVFARAGEELGRLWVAARSIPEAALKRELWHQHLEFVYGTLVDPDPLFLQHTYLTIVAKAMAVQVLADRPASAHDLLAGTPFVQVGLKGAVETDFFDWILLAPGGERLINRIAAQVARFRLSEIDNDVLKTIYESLIDPQQRHYLGEYYTPDWLAEWMCGHSVKEPLKQRVLDPACGSGTFLFHSVRRFLLAAEKEGMPLQQALESCTEHVVGIDVHPVAVLFARVTYLLAIGTTRLSKRTGDLFVPVYLGDALQWDVREFLTEQEIEIFVPGEKPLRFPGSVAADPHLLEKVLAAMREMSDQNASAHAFLTWLNASTRLPDIDRQVLKDTFELMRSLHQAGRNHIWTYIVRNLTRPLWLSMRSSRPDVVIGNPPWLRFNAMSDKMQARFRKACEDRNLWVGGRVATHQDLSSYFFVRSAERYLAVGGAVAFVMPMAALSRLQYRGFLTGSYVSAGDTTGLYVQFKEAWKFDDSVGPLFPVPSTVLFATRATQTAPLPSKLIAFEGQLPSRDASSAQACSVLVKRTEQWPQIGADELQASPYKRLFKQGATIVPRRFLLVVPEPSGRLGATKNAPLVVGRAGAQDKKPWKSISPPKGQVEGEFLRPLLLGESIAPFRILSPCVAIIPWWNQGSRLLNAGGALNAGFPYLAKWLRTSELLWDKHKTSDMSFEEQIDFYGKLSSQFPLAEYRVVYAKAGINPAACVVRDTETVIDHKLYWCPTESLSEAYYLSCFLNSEHVRARIAGRQSRGQFGARDFDKLMLGLPIPKFVDKNPTHRGLAELGARAEYVARGVEVPKKANFQKARKLVRDHLLDLGVSQEIDRHITELLRG